jgi:coenzyme F420-reducing hydrogenase beta subunit
MNLENKKKLKLATHKTCTCCLACVDTCNHNAISVDRRNDGLVYVTVNNSLCAECGLCEKVCPVITISSKKDTTYSSVPWAAWSVNDSIRLKSASGGAFAELALKIIRENGVVIGAAIFGKAVKHIAIEKEEDLHLLQGSKYLQSNTEGIYKKTLELLKSGRTVLFSGLPCQVAGINSYLVNRNYQGVLYTADLICHGVPSANLLDLYQIKLKKEIKQIHSFRDKRSGSGFCLTKEYLNGEIESQSAKEKDFFLISYGKNLSSRSSCYNCQFSTLKRSSDLSLADFWGDHDHPEQHKKGLSLVITNSQLGERLLNESDLMIKKSTWEKALPGNPRIVCGKSFLNLHPVRQRMVKYFTNTNIQTRISAFSNVLSVKNSFNFFCWILLRSMSKVYEKIIIKRFLKLD